MYIILYWNSHGPRWNGEAVFKTFNTEDELAEFVIDSAYYKQRDAAGYRLYPTKDFRIVKVYKVETELNYELENTQILKDKYKEIDDNLPEYFRKKDEIDKQKEIETLEKDYERTKATIVYLEERMKKLKLP